jgi:hypothetical protein
VLDPFKLFGRLLIAGAKIVGYVLTGAAQASWSLVHGRTDKLGDVIGYLGRGITDAITNAFAD